MAPGSRWCPTVTCRSRTWRMGMPGITRVLLTTGCPPRPGARDSWSYSVGLCLLCCFKKRLDFQTIYDFHFTSHYLFFFVLFRNDSDLNYISLTKSTLISVMSSELFFFCYWQFCYEFYHIFPLAATVIQIPPSSAPVVVNRTAFIPCRASYDINLDLVYMWTFNGKLIDFEKDFHYRLVRSAKFCHLYFNSVHCKLSYIRGIYP